MGLDKIQAKRVKRRNRHFRVRRKVHGTPQRMRLVVYRSLKHIYAQIIDDEARRTLCSASTRSADFEGATGNCGAATKVGELLAEKAKAQGIENVVFDRGGCVYHGRVKALAEGARAGGLKF